MFELVCCFRLEIHYGLTSQIIIINDHIIAINYTAKPVERASFKNINKLLRVFINISVSFLIFINIGCIGVQFVPVVGSILGLCGSYYFTCSTLGLNFLDYPLGLRGQRRREKLLFVRQHRMHTLGLGTVVAMLVIVPVVNAVFLTTAVTGAVLLHRRIVGMRGI